MKALIAFLTLSAAGCATRTIEIPPITIAPINVVIASPVNPADRKLNPLVEALGKKVFGTDSAAGQIYLGCVSYLLTAGRWPQTREEIAEGLAAGEFPANRLSEVQKITFREEAGSLVIEFTASGTVPSSGTLRLDPPKEQQPIQPPVPTPGNGR